MKVLIVEDHAMFRDVLEGILVDRLGCKRVTGAATCKEARALFAEKPWEMVVCDVDLPDGDGLELADEFAMKNPRLRIIAVSGQTDEYTLSRVLHSGVMGFVDKTRENLKTLEHALREVMAWRTYYAMSVHQHKLAEKMDPGFYSKILTNKELELMPYFGVGLRNDEIADLLGLANQTIQVHRRNLMKKLGIGSTPELVRYAFRTGFTRASDMIRQGVED